MIRKIFALLALVGLAAAPSWGGVTIEANSSIGTQKSSGSGTTFVVDNTSLKYYSGGYPSKCNKPGWYAGIILKWGAQELKAGLANQCPISFKDNRDRNVSEFKHYWYDKKISGKNSPDGSGIYLGADKDTNYYNTKSGITTSYFQSRIDWSVWINEIDVYTLKKSGASCYEAKLTVSGTTITIQIPLENIELSNAEGVWYPAAAVQDEVVKAWASVDAAFAEFNGTNLRLDRSVSSSTDFVVASGKTLDLNGHMLTIAGGTMTFNDGSVVTGAGSIVRGGGSANALPGAKFSFDPTDLIANKTLYKAVDNGDGTYTIGYNHIHDWQGAASGNTLTVTCHGEGECEAGGVASVTISATGKTYDGQAVVVTVTPSENFGVTGWTIGSVVYKQGNETVDSAINAGDYTAEVTINGFTISQPFTIAKASLTALTISASSFNYMGADQHVDITSVKAGNLTATYEETEDSVRSAKGSGAADVSYAVKVRGTGNFTGEATATWTVKAPTGSFDALSAGAGCTASGNAVTVTDSKSLEYDNNGTWYASMTVTWPHTQTKDDDYVKSAVYTDKAHAQIRLSTTGDTVYSGDAILNGSAVGLSGSVKDVRFSYYWTYTYRNYHYLSTTTWRVPLTVAQIKAAKDVGYLSYELTAVGLAWADRPLDDNGSNPLTEGTWGNAAGIRETTYTLTIPIDENLKLNDQFGNQVYPALPYVAQVGNIKYLQLADAIGVANAGDDKTVNLIGNAEAGTFSVGKNVTVNLGGYGNADAVYMLDCDDVNLGAKVVSTKAEVVRTSVTGFDVKNENNTYTLYRAHLHTWNYALNGDTLTATCVTDDGTPCDRKTIAVQLTVSGAADGVAPTASLGADAELFKSLTGASFGTVGYVRDTDDGAAYGKWYVGDYTASLTVTVGGEDRTLTKAFSIAGTTADKYTSGYAVASRNIRYGSWAEALVAAGEGDIVYRHEGDWSDKTYDFTSDKDVTVDLCGAKLRHPSDGKNAIQNLGSGTVTLVNGRIEQAKNVSAQDFDVVGAAGKDGGFVLGEGLVILNKATTEGGRMEVTVSNIKLEIAGGQYQFAKINGTATITGGTFWKYFNPTVYVPNCGDDYVVREKDSDGKDGNGETITYRYTVLPHEHVLTYEANGNVITVTCTAENADICTYKPNNGEKLTLTAASVTVADLGGGAYAGAGYVCTDKFPVKDAVITYWQGDQQLTGAPTDTGDYVATVTVGEATAEAAFRIIHEHSYSYAVEGDSIVATCEAVGSCDAPRFTATLTADGATYTGSAYTGASTSVDTGYPTEVALTYWQGDQQLDGAPTNAGDYIAKMSAGGQTVEEAFTIAKADFASVTFELEKGEFTFDHAAHTAVLATHALGGYVLQEGMDYTVGGDVLTQVGSPAEDKTYTIEIAAAGDNFTGSRTLQWTIKTPITGTAKFGTPSVLGGAYGTVEGYALKVTDTTKMVYGNNAWAIGVTVKVPYDGDLRTPTAFLYFDSPKAESAIVSTDAKALGDCGIVVSDADMTSGQGYRRADAFTWVESITLAEVEAALVRGETKIVRTLRAYAMPYDARVLGIGYHNDGGIKVTEFAMEIPLADLVLAVPAGETLAAGDAAISGYRLLLGKGAKVTANEKVAGFRDVIVPQEKSEIVKESGNGPYTYSAVNKGLMILFGIGQ